MADVTVAQFAEVLKVPVDRLLQQLDQAGIKVDGAEDMISEDAKHELLTLRRKSQSELKLASPQGRARTVNVEVRSKRTYVKREVLEDQARHQQEEIERQRETEEQAKAALERVEKERLDRERLEEENRRRSDEENRKRSAEEEARRQAEVLAREQTERERKAATAAAAKPA